jgi:membrane fusion protein, multidrug efflux system
MTRNGWIGSSLLLIIVAAAGLGLAAMKYTSIQERNRAAASHPEPMESITVAAAKERKHRQTVTSIGTVTALRSITLQNEVPGTVRQVHFTSGQILGPGALLITLDVSVEMAELKEQEARAALAQTQLNRMERVSQSKAISELEVDRARAELDVALAQVARTKAIIARKMIRAPFRARAGISDVHPGQYLNEGTQLTTLQGVDDFAHVNFAVAQQVAAALRTGDRVEVYTINESQPIEARIVAIDSLIDSATRNAMLRARINGGAKGPAPGASVRVEVPSGETRTAVAIPVSALRKGPQGDHVFVVSADKEGKNRAHVRQVQAGTMLGDEVLILDGLSAGEKVAASGSFKLRESALVSIASAL